MLYIAPFYYSKNWRYSSLLLLCRSILRMVRMVRMRNSFFFLKDDCLKYSIYIIQNISHIYHHLISYWQAVIMWDSFFYIWHGCALAIWMCGIWCCFAEIFPRFIFENSASTTRQYVVIFWFVTIQCHRTRTAHTL